MKKELLAGPFEVSDTTRREPRQNRSTLLMDGFSVVPSVNQALNDRPMRNQRINSSGQNKRQATSK